MRCDDPDPDMGDEPAVAFYCPPCAASEFDYRPDVAARYVCAWDPLPTEAAREVYLLDDLPAGLDQLRSVLLAEHTRRQRDGLA